MLPCLRHASLGAGVLALALAAAAPVHADLVYVLNSTDPSIVKIDTRTGEEVQRIDSLREVHHLVLSPDRKELLIADSFRQ